MGQFEALGQMLVLHLISQSSNYLTGSTDGGNLLYAAFNAVLFIICILFLKQRLLLRDTGNEPVSHC